MQTRLYLCTFCTANPCTFCTTNVVTGVSFTLVMSHGILPERFSDGDFRSWLNHFERCAIAKSWDATKHLAMLPAFLQGPAATYYESLPPEGKDTFAHLSEHLLACFSPLVDRERHY